MSFVGCVMNICCPRRQFGYGTWKYDSQLNACRPADGTFNLTSLNRHKILDICLPDRVNIWQKTGYKTGCAPQQSVISWRECRKQISLGYYGFSTRSNLMLATLRVPAKQKPDRTTITVFSYL